MEEHLYRTFYEVETRHWWFVARQMIIEHLVHRDIQLTKGSRVLDVGCGTGAILASFSKDYECYGTDTSPLAIEFCRKRNLKEVYQCTLENFPHADLKFDLILMLDVIEHIGDDRGILRQASRLLKPGGHILITVPAYQFLWSKHDDVNFHKRRYVKSGLRQVFEETGMKIQLLSYYNTILFPLALISRFAQKILPTQIDKTLEIPPPFFNSLLTRTFSLERYLIGQLSLPFGLSLVGIAALNS